MNKMSVIPEEAFTMLLNYSRFLIDLKKDLESMNLETMKDCFPTPEELVQSRNSDIEFTEEQWKEILDIINVWENMKVKDESLRLCEDEDDSDELPNFPDEDGFTSRLLYE